MGGDRNLSAEETAEAVRLARARQVAFLDRMRTDPDEAMNWVFPLDVYVALPAEVARLVETPASGRADLDLRWSTALHEHGDALCRDCRHGHRLYLGGEAYAAYGRHLREPALPVLGTAVFAYVLQDQALVLDRPLYPVGSSEREAARELFGEVVAHPDVPEVPAQDGAHWAVLAGQVQAFQSPGQLAQAAEAIQAAESIAREERRWAVEWPRGVLAGDSGGYQPSMTQSSFFDDDKIDVLFIRCDFSDFPGAAVSQTDLASDLAAVSAHLNTMSYGTASVTATVTSTVYRATGTGTAYAQAGDNDGLYNDVVAAYDASPEALASSGYDVVAISFPDLDGVSGSQITYGGLASVGGSRLWLNGITFSSGRINVITHEFGHNYGLHHSNYWHPEQELGGSYYGSPPNSLEYGDIFDLMGDGDMPEAHFNPYQKHRIDWLPENHLATATGDGTYRIYRFDHIDALDNPLLALRVPVGGDVTWWVGHRQLFDGNPNLESGAYVVAEGLYEDRPNLLDLTPESTAGENSDRFDAALPPGSSYEDALAGVSLTTVASGTNGSGDAWIDVSVDFEPRVGFSDALFEFEEAAGVAHLTLNRSMDSSGALSVDYATSGGTATSGTDYYATSGRVSWADGDLSSKTITVHLRPDAVAEAGESFTVTLSNPTGGMIEFGRGSAEVSILDPGERYQSFAPDYFNNVVNAIAFQSDGRAVVGGTIDHSSGAFSGAGNIARLEVDGAVDSNFNEGGSGFNGEVEVLVALDDDRLLVSGSFTSYNNLSVPGLVCLEADGAIDTSFLANLGTGPNDLVDAIAEEADGRILIGGRFDSFDGSLVDGLLRLNPSGAPAPALSLPFAAGSSPAIRSIQVLPDGDFLVAGSFYIGSTGSGFRSGVARLNGDGSRDSSFDPDAGLHATGQTSSLRTGYAVAVHPDGGALAGGLFTAYDENATANLVRTNADGSFGQASPLVFDNVVNQLLVEPYGGLLVGKWEGAGSELVRIAGDWTLDSDFSRLGGADGSLRALAFAPDGSLWVGGNFFDYNGSTSRPVVRLASGVSPYDRWAAMHFTGSERMAGTADADADPDGDEIPNLGEMALGTDPNEVDPASAFGGGYVEGLSLSTDGSDDYLQLTLDKSALEGGVWYGVQVSSDLTKWSPDPATPGDDSAFEVIEDSRDRLIIRDRTPVSPGSPRFVRLVLKGFSGNLP